MKELWLKFWTMESYAIRALRVLGVSLGFALASGAFLSLPPWVGVTVMVVSAALSGNETHSGIGRNGV